MSALVVLPDEGEEIQLGGFGVVFKLLSEQVGGTVGVVEHPLAPGTLAAPMHTHDREHEISYVLEGEVTLKIGDDIVVGSPGTLVVKPKGIPHTFWNAGSTPARILEIIAPGGFERYFLELGRLFAETGGVPDIARIAELTGKYGLHMHMESIGEIAEKYGVTLGGS